MPVDKDMEIITLTTDFGSGNYYTAILKGSILSISSHCQLLDITHDISNFDITEAAFIIDNTFRVFPANAINVLAVNSFYSQSPRILLLYREGYYFIAPDNGILSLIFDDLDAEECVYLDYEGSIADVSSVIANIISKVTEGGTFGEIGSMPESVSKRISLKPVVSGKSINATVLFNDKFGNAIINVKRDLFERAAKGREFRIYFSPRNFIDKIHSKYSDVSFGDEVCIFNSAGYMEIAVYMGNATEMLELARDSAVQIVFSE